MGYALKHRSSQYLTVTLPNGSELELDLPPTAIGKDYLPEAALVARAPSGSGFQLSLAGLLGVTLAVEEGVELNLLGLTIGLDAFPPALKLPGIGRLGVPEDAQLGSKSIE